ncbi:MAG TPA: ATP-binding protein [Prolixibacteraceae bacterium]|nr:sensor histidine kinase [Prolixibacteraceae bacterium]OQB81811.1 MAG: Alkaline phosphatase synthesis sensor protein PhoR [Bacteroidetes bacterium ADurb.Bin123]HOC85358.1 ATP-binding protein [Prolixibacteraceae bacterium]HOF54211.1 ATP-binding protein [Prolixibacteraceae bacterium]HOR99177.1 ATP-binding protein [Prolixibacteraceae bacterium]
MKTYSSRQLAFHISVILSVLAGFLMLAAYYSNAGLWLMLSLILVFAVSAYFIMHFFLKIYISDKIKPVYKTILDLPASGKKQDNYRDTNGNILSELKTDVEAWANIQTQEIERLKDLERYRKEFVGNVSHELKTPIFNIQGYILTLLEGGIDNPKINKLYLHRTENNINRMISIIEDLESITKLESGELKLKIEKFDIVRLSEEVFEMEQMQAAERKMNLEFSVRPDKPIYVLADRKRINEVLNNLINNGIKYGKKNGFVRVGFYDMEDHVMVEVSDDGIGMEKKDLPRVFERFFRVDKSRSREQGGTGLGLSIVKHIIEAHNQRINVKSKVEEGTTFTFSLEKAK